MISSLSPTIEPKRCRAKVVDHEKFQAIQLIRVGLNSTYHEFSFLFYKMVPRAAAPKSLWWVSSTPFGFPFRLPILE